MKAFPDTTKVLFVTGTSTGVGKTMVTRAVAAGLNRDGRRVCAIKPVETGCAPHAEDAMAIARAAEHAPAEHQGFYRAQPPLAPAAIASPPPPHVSGLVRAVADFAHGTADAIRTDAPPQVLLVEGAGGVRVPLNARQDMAHLMTELSSRGARVVLVARNALGVLSDVLVNMEALHRRHIPVQAIVLSHCQAESDMSARTNAQILQDRLKAPIVSFPFVKKDTIGAMSRAAVECGLLRAVLDGHP